MPLPAAATQQATAALAAAGVTGLQITSQRTGTGYVTTWVRVSAGIAGRVLSVLRNLPGAVTGGSAPEVWVRRPVNP